mgnify:CR=1 FL=1|jgi:hypothetical protein
MAAEHDVQDSAKVDMEPGYKPANPSHHSLNFQDRVRSHPELGSTAPTTMTKSEELAALMSVSSPKFVGVDASLLLGPPPTRFLPSIQESP